MEAHRHHPRGLGPFGIEHVEAVLEVGVELVARVEALRGGEAHVVGVERVGHDELRPALDHGPPGQLVIVVVGVVEEAAILGDEAAGVGAGAAGVPAQRALAGNLGQDLHGVTQMLALDLLGHVLVVDPLQAVARDLVAGIDHGADRRRVPLGGGGDGEDGERDPLAVEQAEQAPDADAGAVLVDLLHADVAHAFKRLGADDLGEEGLGSLVAVQDRVLAALLVVEDELQGDAGAAGPVGMGRVRPVADQVAWIRVHGSSPARGQI